jgi:chromosomal replication initiation ATPase DnaA
MPHQLPLPFQHQPRYEAGDFIAACSNQEALAWLGIGSLAMAADVDGGPSPAMTIAGDTEWPERRLALFGPEGCGKSHLLHIWAERTGAVLLSGSALTDLESVPSGGGLALDDADRVGDETQLFHLLNTARDRGLQLLLAARAAPSRWPVRLPDLSSRLRAITAVAIAPPDDDLLAALLKRLVADRQLVMPQAAHDWVLHHLPRSPAVLREAVARLDKASLASRAPITRPLAVKILKEGDFAAADADEVSMSGIAPSSEAGGIL